MDNVPAASNKASNLACVSGPTKVKFDKSWLISSPARRSVEAKLF